MSVFVTLKVAADRAKLEEIMRANPERVDKINSEAKNMGAIHHKFLASNGTIMVLDEWDAPESFQKFFENSTEVADIMKEVGASSAPEITIWEKLDTRDEF